MIIQSYILQLFYCLLFFLILSSCNNANKQIEAPDISNIDFDLKLVRSDQLLFKSKGAEFIKKIIVFEKEHNAFLNHFSSKVMQFKAYNDTSKSHLYKLEAFLNHKDIHGLFLDCDSLYLDMENEKDQLENAFKTIKYYYPNTKNQVIYTYISAFNIASYIAEDHIGIGLDFFMGSDYKKYLYSQHPQYLIKEFKKSNLPIWTIKNYLEVNFPIANSKNLSLLDHLLYKGKNTLMLNYCFPKTDVHNLLGYSKEQIEWCIDNEREIWLFFSERNLLFEKDERKYLKFINPGPTTAGMPTESPGNIGSWLGFMIIKSALRNNPNKDLLWVNDKIKDPQSFLSTSKYRP